MKEKIYTIPVTEAFNQDVECPLCSLVIKLDDEYVNYFLGPSLMEPDMRIETNRDGFCKTHFEKLFNKQENRLGLGLIIDTHLIEQNNELKKLCSKRTEALRNDSGNSIFRNIFKLIVSKPAESDNVIDEMVAMLASLADRCCICAKLDYTMDRYIDVIFHLWKTEPDFREIFNTKKGFCFKHFMELLKGARKYLSSKDSAGFLDIILKMQLDNMERIQQEVNWFTKKFDYRNNEAPWGNSKDAVRRSIGKITGPLELK